jgi:protoporphyrinogen oxidase
MGRAASETLWEPLLRAKFGDYAGQILMSWMWARLHYRTSSLGYIRGGFQQLYAKLVERIRELGGTLYFNEAVEGITPSDGALAVWCAGQSNVYEQVVSTLPIAITCRLTPALPAAYRELHGQPLAYGAHCAILELNRRFMRPYWVNVSDPGLPFLAAVEHTNMLPASDYGGKHLMYLGNYLPMQHPLFKQSDQQVVDTFLAALPRLNPAFRPEWVTGSHVFKAPFAQPIVTAEFLERLPGHETPLRGLYVASMFQVYPQDRGQSYSIAMANRVADLVLAAQPDRQPQPA